MLGRPKARVTLEEFQNTIDALCDYVFLVVMYNWGEPLLHKDFPALVRCAVDHGIAVHASSNLSVPLSERQCTEIIASGLQLLLVGVDGATPKTHALYRRGSDLAVVHRNLRSLVAAKKQVGATTPKIVAEFLVFRHNRDEISEFTKQMTEIGVYPHPVPPLLPGDDSLQEAGIPEFDRYQQHAVAISRLRTKGNRLSPCTWLYYSSTINPGGSVSPCCMVTNEKADFGRISQRSKPHQVFRDFRSTWNGTKYRAARALFRPESVMRWADQNLCRREPDGMGLAQANRSIPLICSECPIPEDLEMWSNLVSEMFVGFSRGMLHSVRSFRLRSALRLGVRATLLGIAAWLQ